MSPREYRELIRGGADLGLTSNVCGGYAQAQLDIVPKKYAFDYLLFCIRNPRPCPVLDVTDPGSPHPMRAAPQADLRTDLSQYNVYINGKIEAEPKDIKSYWSSDFVAFLIGCSLSIDWVLRTSDINFRTTGAYMTNIQCTPAGPFKGPLVVTCRLIKGKDVATTIRITSCYPTAHGAPIHVGNPAGIGIKDLYHPDMLKPSVPVTPKEADEIPLFWACGLTTRVVALEAKLPTMVTGAVGRLFVTDLPVEKLANQ